MIVQFEYVKMWLFEMKGD